MPRNLSFISTVRGFIQYARTTPLVSTVFGYNQFGFLRTRSTFNQILLSEKY